MIAYFDSSAAVKLLIDEEGSDLAVLVWEAASRRIASRLLYPEVRGALTRAHRGGRIDDQGLLRARQHLVLLERAVEPIGRRDRYAAGGGGDLGRRVGEVGQCERYGGGAAGRVVGRAALARGHGPCGARLREESTGTTGFDVDVSVDSVASRGRR